MHLSKLVIWGSSWGRGFRFRWSQEIAALRAAVDGLIQTSREQGERTAAAELRAKDCTREITKVKLHWKTPLNIHWNMPLMIHDDFRGVEFLACNHFPPLGARPRGHGAGPRRALRERGPLIIIIMIIIIIVIIVIIIFIIIMV